MAEQSSLQLDHGSNHTGPAKSSTRVGLRAWAVLDGHGSISELYVYKAFAEGAKSNRGDGSQCVVVPVEVHIIVEQAPVYEAKRKGRKK